MISQVLSSPVGNALKIYFEPGSAAQMTVILRNLTGIFSGYTDTTAENVYAGSPTGITCILDDDGIENGTSYFYGEFDYDGSTWSSANVLSGTPESTYFDQSVDVLSILRNRLDVGIKNEILIGTLTPSSTEIQVLNAPPIFEETTWPVISVHVASDGPGERGIGELTEPDLLDPETQEYIEGVGWLSDVQITVVGWSKNPDERIALRKALRKIILGNLEIFDMHGMLLVTFNQSDVDELSSFPAPVYEAMGTFSCKAPASVGNKVEILTTAPTISVTSFP